MKFFLRGIYYLFLTLAATVALLLTISALPLKNNIKFYVVLSGSMRPSIPAGAVVLSRPASSYGVGDIITFRAASDSKDVITHRIVAGENNNFRTQGDANNAPDPTLISPSQILGKNVLSLPYLGYLVEFTKTPRGFILFIVVPATILIWEEIKSLQGLFKKPAQPKTILEELKEDRSPSGYPAFIFVLISLVLGTSFVSFAHSFFADKEVSLDNVLGALGPTPSIISPLPLTSPIPTSVPAGVIINEINWGGANGDGNDEWVELYNPTSSPIDLTNWVIANLGGGGPNSPITIPSGTIPSNGYFLISHSDAPGSKINIPPDFVTTDTALVDAGEQLILINSTSVTVDTANGPGAWFAGSNSTPKKSMERVGADGTLAASWQTATTHTNMDGTTSNDEFATPRAANGI